MAKKKEAKALDTTTEEKIKSAARVAFHKKDMPLHGQEILPKKRT